MSKLLEIVANQIRFLFFRPISPDFKNDGNYYLALGIFTAWLAGIGRYWDNPRAELWQYLGLGSLAYIFVLALILWLLVMPLRPENWSYKNVLTFVGMTSLPGVIYATPVERFLSFEASQDANVAFLAIVAAWRVALLFQYLKKSAKLQGFTIVIAALLPLVLIVTVLTALNLEHVVFRLMAGLEDHEKTANDAAYLWLVFITYFSVLASPILVLIYGGMIYFTHHE
jgi:hypothetical protein